jgi:hypothetical protein
VEEERMGGGLVAGDMVRIHAAGGARGERMEVICEGG